MALEYAPCRISKYQQTQFQATDWFHVTGEVPSSLLRGIQVMHVMPRDDNDRRDDLFTHCFRDVACP
jgi:hypothetical protein